MSEEWKRHFKIGELETPGGVSELFDCLEKGALEPTALLAWAKTHYQLPALKPSYFSQKPPQDLWRRYGNIWPFGVVPLREWKGTLFLGCLVPPEEFRAPQKIAWLLCPYKELKSWHEIMLRELLGAPSSNLQGLTSSEAEMTQTKALDFSEVEPLDTPGDGPPKTEAPEGLTVALPEPPSSELPSGLEIPSEAQEKASAPSTPPSPNGPTGLDLPSAEKREISSTATMPPVPEVPDGLSHQVAPPPEVSSPVGLAKEDVMPPSPEPEIPTIVASQPSENVKAPPPPPNLPPPPVQATEAPQPSPTQAVSAKSDASDMESLANEMLNFHERAMILHCSSEKATPTFWKGPWTQDPHRQLEIDLTQPSVFRIATRSSAPFFGKPVANLTNDAFFETWAEGKYPNHFSVLPVSLHSQVVALIVGYSTHQEAPDLEELHHIMQRAEKEVQRLASQLKKAG